MTVVTNYLSYVASTVTPTPLGRMASETASAICFVSLSCVCSLRLNISTILENNILLF